MTAKRRITLKNQEYSFRFNNPKGVPVKCTILNGTGTVVLYKLESDENTKELSRAQTGTRYDLSAESGRIFYVELNTDDKSTWDVEFSGTGTFQLELQEKLISRKRGMYTKHSAEKKRKFHNLPKI